MSTYKRHGNWRWHRILKDVRNNQPNLWNFNKCPRWWLDSELDNAYDCVGKSKKTYSNLIVIVRCVYRAMRRYKIVRNVKNWNDLVLRVANRLSAHHMSYKRLLIGDRETKKIKLLNDEFEVCPFTYISHMDVNFRYQRYIRKCKEEKQIVYEALQVWNIYYYEQVKRLSPGIPIIEAIKIYKKRLTTARNIEKEDFELYQCKQILRQIKRKIDENTKNNRAIA
jgi:hypothetical protein